MNTIQLPPTVQKALGEEAANDLASWLDKRFEHSTGDTQISAYTARQKANVFVLENVSNLLLANNPELQKIGSKWVWQVPIDLTLTGKGRIGRVGVLVIDANYGEIYYDNALINQLKATADQLIHEATTP